MFDEELCSLTLVLLTFKSFYSRGWPSVTDGDGVIVASDDRGLPLPLTVHTALYQGHGL